MDEALFEKVKNYFNGEMSQEERSGFESSLATNKDLAAIVDLYQTIEDGIFDTEEFAEEEKKLRNILSAVHEQYRAAELRKEAPNMPPGEKEPPPPALQLKHASVPPQIAEHHPHDKKQGKVRSIPAWRSMAVAATIIGLMIIGAVLFLQTEDKRELAGRSEEKAHPETPPTTDTLQPGANAPVNPIAVQDKDKAGGLMQDSTQLTKTYVPDRAEREKLYARNFQPDSIPSNFSDLLQEALQHYQQHEYRDAVAAIDVDAIKATVEDLRPRGQPDAQQEKEENLILFYAHYYKALSNLAVGAADKAITGLRSALAISPDHYWQSKTQWYLALAYLKTGEVEAAKKWLKRVANTNKGGAFKQKAATLIRELEKNK